MLDRFSNLSTNVMNIIIYTTSPYLDYFLKSALRDMYKMHKDFSVDVDTLKAVQNAKLDSHVAPLMCDKWMINVNADKLNKKELLSALNNNTVHGITVYWTSKYMVYRQLIDSDAVKKQGVMTPNFSFSRLGYRDIQTLHLKLVPQNKALNNELFDYVAKNYTFDPNAVLELFTLLKSGGEVSSKRDIIEAIGVGGNSVGSLTVKILSFGTTSDDFPTPKKEEKKPPKLNKDGTEKKPRKKLTPAEKELKSRKNALASSLKLIDDLSVSYKHDTIRKFMLSTIDAFIEIKQLQIMGIYGKITKEIPDTFDTKRMAMNKRFEQFVLSEITLPKLLNLKLCLLNYDSFNAEIALIQALSEFYNNVNLSKPDK